MGHVHQKEDIKVASCIDSRCFDDCWGLICCFVPSKFARMDTLMFYLSLD